MRKAFKKYFIPHSANDYRPHILRGLSILIITGAILCVLFLSFVHVTLLTSTNLFAAIIPSVLVDLANSDRAQSDVQLLTISPVLQQAAQAKANDMARGGYFAHTSPEGRTPWYWFGQVGYRFSYAGENLAVNFSDSRDVDAAWMNSPGHRANILNKNFTEIGIAMARGRYQDKETVFIVQMFGRPARSLAAGSKSPVVMQSPFIETITENDLFIGVRNSEVAAAESQSAPDADQLPAYRVFIRSLIASPKYAPTYAYLILSFFVIL